ncbi:hypothetical protein BJ138DRAFT_996455 [Hygrophoropsis aurantiaca]|uniref:Uncharacterized protein n=1 Tax=Hygrophoropsis aurantiaca TaxID=72124 RepID=A0ACB8ATP0_9AGAM|nr:hypothetical protein BJ138DRAFT_996455 [Hygrophoropsis aurantiaca]
MGHFPGTTNATHTLRPNPVRQDTEGILSYYQSADAGWSPSHGSESQSGSHSRSGSGSTSCSDYSSESARAEHVTQSQPPPTTAVPGVRRRPSIPSEGSSDRRRLAIVQMDSEVKGVKKPREAANADRNKKHQESSKHGPDSPSNSLRSRRGHEARLTLVAPPDASPAVYTRLTPPMTAPIPQVQLSQSTMSVAQSQASHNRSSSEVPAFSVKGLGHVRGKASREVAIVGTRGSTPSDGSHQNQPSPVTDNLRPPLFQMPQSRRSPSPIEVSDSSSGHARRRKDALSPAASVSPIKELKEMGTPITTPAIGESKNIGDRVAGPVIVNLYPDSPTPSSRASSQKSVSPVPFSPSKPPYSPAPSSTSAMSSPYLFYQPGVHATAGPLPPPPMAILNLDPNAPPPPRPPRMHTPLRRRGDMDAVKNALQLPASVTAALNAKLSSPTKEQRILSSSPPKPTIPVPVVVLPPEEEGSNHASTPASSVQDSTIKSYHVREGAFPPSRSCTSEIDDAVPSPAASETSLSHPLPPPRRHESIDDLVADVGDAIDDMGIMNASDVPPPTVIEPPRFSEGKNSRPALEIRRISISLDRSQQATPSSEESRGRSSPDPDRTLPLERSPPLPPKQDPQDADAPRPLKNALNIKRFSSLPRTPSIMSLNRLSSGSKRSSRTPSPSILPPIPRSPPVVVKIKSSWPPAMHFAEVVVKKSALERSLGYAHKINELYMYDCGLGDWLWETKYKAANPQSSAKRNMLTGSSPRHPSNVLPTHQPRHVSESSTGSEITFPRRADAYFATDLTSPPAGDVSPPTAPPPLPYPALAIPRTNPSRSSTIMVSSSSSSGRSMTSPSSAKSPGNFFSSLGRKTSLKKERDGGPLSLPSPAKVLSKSPPRPAPNPRPINIPTAPSMPGGPRALPGRMQRSQTIMVSPQSSPNAASAQRSSTMARRPSLFGGRASKSPDRVTNFEPEEFSRQVEKLAALLPRADKNVLAGYLRRSGQDILAIGQYLEDEKNGTLRYD